MVDIIEESKQGLAVEVKLASCRCKLGSENTKGGNEKEQKREVYGNIMIAGKPYDGREARGHGKSDTKR